jgi:hypothetical protein
MLWEVVDWLTSIIDPCMRLERVRFDAETEVSEEPCTSETVVECQ